MLGIKLIIIIFKLTFYFDSSNIIYTFTLTCKFVRLTDPNTAFPLIGLVIRHLKCKIHIYISVGKSTLQNDVNANRTF